MAWVLSKEGRTDKVLFSESNGRFVVEVSPSAERKFNALMNGLNVGPVGEVQNTKSLELVGLDGKTSKWALSDLESSWRGGLKP